jgi:endonuclease III
MPLTVIRQKLISQVLSRKEEVVAVEPAAEPAQESTVMEHLLFAICREESSQEKAEAVFRHLQERFFDWNELRVSSPREVAEALAGLTNPRARAERMISFLQEHFESTFGFDLEGLHKKGVKGAAKQLENAKGVSDFTLAWISQRSLRAHAVPVDAPMIRCLKRLGILDATVENATEARASLEEQVAKNHGVDFTDQLSRIALEFCHERNPVCGTCPLATDCPSVRAPSAPRVRKPK